MDCVDLKIKSVIGFNGKIPLACNYTPCGNYLVYPLGSFIVLKNVQSGKEAFLDGHNNDVSCVAMSHNGEKLASGISHLTGVKANVIIWDLNKAKRMLEKGSVMIGEACALYHLRQHLGKVQAVSFSPSDTYLATLGGQDDNALVIWDVDSGSSICGSPASSDSAFCVQWLNGRDDRLVSGGNYHLRVWQVDYSLPKLHPMDAKLGSVRRVVLSVAITEDDHTCFCGTSSGDILKVNIDRNEILSYKDPDTQIPSIVGLSEFKFALGVRSLYCSMNQKTGNINLLVGAGDGVLSLMNTNSMKPVAGYKTQLMGGITSISVHPKGGKFMVGTSECNRYEVSSDLIDSRLLSSCHYGAINDVAFPDGCPDLCVTSSQGDMRIWNLKTNQEVLRIQVPNLECLCSCVAPSGTAILSGWDDGKIRSFYPESGKIKFVIPDAHTEKVTALAIADNDARGQWRVVSGGAEGRVRIWKITPSHQAMIISLKEHRGPITAIKVNGDSSQCISASADGSCIIWDLNKYVRLNALFESNVFESVLYHPDESQMLTCGSNHKISYWDSSDGEVIRVIDGGENHMTCLDITANGEYFISGSKDKTVKVWHYDNGITCALGLGHSGEIKAVRISPDEKSIVSVGSTGEIIFWEMPNLRKISQYIDSVGN
jgi:WD40 repeat protein